MAGRDESQCCSVHAIPQAGGRWAILKDMSQMGQAGLAKHFYPVHGKGMVHFGGNGLRSGRLEETGPAGAGIILGVTVKKGVVAADAAVLSGLLVVPAMPCERWLRPVFTGDPVLFRGEE